MQATATALMIAWAAALALAVIRFAPAMFVAIMVLIAACGSRTEHDPAHREDGAGPARSEVVRPIERRHDRGIAAIDLAEVALLMPPLPFLSVRESLHHARRVQRLEATYCAAEPADAVVPRVIAAIGDAGWIPSSSRPRPGRTDDVRISARRDPYRLSAAVTSAAPGDCDGTAETVVRLIVHKVADG